MTAIAVNGGHVARALEFFHASGKYMIIGGSTPWSGAGDLPPAPTLTDFRLVDVIGLRRFSSMDLVIPDPAGDILYRNRRWKRVIESIDTSVTQLGVAANSQTVPVLSVAGLRVGDKVRVADLYEGQITNISGTTLTLDTSAPTDILEGATVLGGAVVEGAKYIYIKCAIEYDSFPLATYRQLGIVVGAVPANSETLLSAAYSTSGDDEYTSLGRLEVLDNRAPITRDSDMQEVISFIIEF